MIHNTRFPTVYTINIKNKATHRLPKLKHKLQSWQKQEQKSRQNQLQKSSANIKTHGRSRSSSSHQLENISKENLVQQNHHSR